MSKWFVGLVSCILFTTSLQAHMHSNAGLEIASGYRRDGLHWGFTHHIVDPFTGNVIEREREIRWKLVDTAQVVGTARYVNCDNYFFKASAGYGSVYNGEFHREDEIEIPLIPSSSSSSNSSSDASLLEELDIFSGRSKIKRGDVYDFSGGIGYFFRFLCGRVTFAPMIGYSYHVQRFHMRTIRIHQLFSPPRTESFRTHYITRWRGPWVGAELTIYMLKNLWGFISGEYHWNVRFNSRGSRQIINVINDFHQHGEGRGYVYTAGVNYDITDCIAIGLQGGYQAWRTREAKTEVPIPGGELIKKIPVIHWHNWNFMGTIGIYF